MPKTKYDNEAEIPADQKGAYAQKADGKWWLTDLETDHPLMLNKTNLETTQTNLKNQVNELNGQKTELENKVQELSSKTIPAGHRVVSNEDAALAETAKAQGLTKDKIPVMVTENTRYKQAEELQTKTKSYEEIAAHESVGFNPAAFAKLALLENLNIQKLIEKVDGKEITKFVVVEKDGDGEKKTNVKDFVEKSESFQTFKDSLLAKPEPTKPNSKFPTQKERETGNNTGKTAAERRVERQNRGLVEEKSNNAGAK